jgi:hypothetical protein
MAGFRLNLKLVLYLQSQLKTQSLGFLNPPLLQAAGRYKPFYEKTANIHIFPFITSIFLQR